MVVFAEDEQTMQLVMPAVLGGELHQLLEDVGALAEGEVQFYAACIVEALQHLHAHGIVYRDLKADNVLLSGGFSSAAAGWPVLADFGLANFVQSDNLHSFCGTPAFVAPEVVTHSGHGTAADWWGLGVLIYQCFTLNTPFSGPHTKATLDNIAQGRRVHHAPVAAEQGNEARTGELPARAAAMIDALLQHDPAERLGGALRSDEVRVHPFFWGFDWTSIEKRQMTPPHAARCRARAVLATQHPDLCLSPLPNLSTATEQTSKADASKEVPPRPTAAPAPAATRRMICSTSPDASDDDDVDIGDFV